MIPLSHALTHSKLRRAPKMNPILPLHFTLSNRRKPLTRNGVWLSFRTPPLRIEHLCICRLCFRVCCWKRKSPLRVISLVACLAQRDQVVWRITARFPTLKMMHVEDLVPRTTMTVLANMTVSEKNVLAHVLLCGYPQAPLARPEGRLTSFVNVEKGFLPVAPFLPLRTFNH